MECICQNKPHSNLTDKLLQFTLCEVRRPYKHATLSPTELPEHRRSVKSVFFLKLQATCQYIYIKHIY